MLTVLYFTATWCGPCKMFGPVFSQVQTEYAGKVNMTKVDVDQTQNHNIVQTHLISSVPTLVFLKDGVVVNKRSGVMTKSELSQLVSYYA
jgi:thioredoxin 1